ncbi:MAG TPA: ATP-binding protein, partial [Methylomirabilota bacterium]|nr:ATP-binding protein [Methylomirabilota bacterium]
SEGVDAHRVFSERWRGGGDRTGGLQESEWPIEFAGRRWLIRCVPEPDFPTAYRPMVSRLVLAGGLFGSGILAAYLWSALGRSARIAAIVEQRTRELAAVNADLARQNDEHRRTEEALMRQRRLVDTLMESIPDHIYFKDQHSRFLRVSRSMARMFGAASSEEVAGKTDFDFFTAEHASRARQDEEEVMRTGVPLVGREEKETWPDGSVTWVSTTKQALRDATGRVIGTFGISRDITARKLAEEELAVKARELARSNEDLEQFAYVASHDLQEPLRMISSYTQMLERRYHDQLDDKAREYLRYAVDGARRMQELINDLLTYSRLGTRRQPLTEVDMNEVLRRAEANLRIAIEESGARILQDRLPKVAGDLVQLTQLLQNLLGNAIKFRGPAPPEIRVTAAPDPAAEGGWEFRVADNGIGIDRKHFERIFVLFQRLHTREQYAGTGIGLAVCKKIVERHGGRIWVESEPGKGSTFHFTLPQNPPGTP